MSSRHEVEALEAFDALCVQRGLSRSEGLRRLVLAEVAAAKVVEAALKAGRESRVPHDHPVSSDAVVSATDSSNHAVMVRFALPVPREGGSGTSAARTIARNAAVLRGRCEDCDAAVELLDAVVDPSVAMPASLPRRSSRVSALTYVMIGTGEATCEDQATGRGLQADRRP